MNISRYILTLISEIREIFTPKVNEILLSNLFGIVIVALNNAFRMQDVNVFLYSEFVIVPMLMGIICTWFWRKLNLRKRDLFGNLCLTCLATVVLSNLLFNEGFICLIIASPILLSFMTFGGFVGRAMFKKNDQTLNGLATKKWTFS